MRAILKCFLEQKPLADPGFEVRGGGGRGSSGIHESQRAQANSSDKQKTKQKKGRLASSSSAEGRWILGGGAYASYAPPDPPLER